MRIPSELTAGDSYTWNDDATTDNLGNVVDSSWTLYYAIRQAAVSLSLTATTNGSGWTTTISKTQSATFAAGTAYWQAYAEKASSRVTLGSGQINFKPNISTAASNTELRSQTQQDLDAVQAAMRAMISGGAVAEYSIGGRSLRKIALADLIQLESMLKSRLVRERKADDIANGLGNPSNMFVRFR